MQGNDITSGPSPGDIDPAAGSYLDVVVSQAVAQIPPIEMAGTMKVQAVVVPGFLGTMHPVCAWEGELGEHPLQTEAWKDVDTDMVYCKLRCAAEHAIRLDARPEEKRG